MIFGENSIPYSKNKDLLSILFTAIILCICYYLQSSLWDQRSLWPHFDEVGYVTKIWKIQDIWHNQSFLSWFSIAQYFSIEPVYRPPFFLILVALVTPFHASLDCLAHAWVLLGLSFAIFGWSILGFLLNDWRWLPPCACITFTPLVVWQALYLVDIAPALFTTIPMALILYDYEKHSVFSSTLACFFILLAFLIRPTTVLILSYISIVCIIYKIYIILTNSNSKGSGSSWMAMWASIIKHNFIWALPWLLLPCFMAWSFFDTPYGQSWLSIFANSDKELLSISGRTFRSIYYVVSTGIPPWLWILSLFAILFSQNLRRSIIIPILVFPIFIFISYYFYFKSTFNSRYLYSILPCASCLLCIWLSRSKYFYIITNIYAAICFSMSCATLFVFLQQQPSNIISFMRKLNAKYYLYLAIPQLPTNIKVEVDSGAKNFISNILSKIPDNKSVVILNYVWEFHAGSIKIFSYLFPQNEDRKITWYDCSISPKIPIYEPLLTNQYFAVIIGTKLRNDNYALVNHMLTELIINRNSPLFDYFQLIGESQLTSSIARTSDKHLYVKLYKRINSLSRKKLLEALNWLRNTYPNLPIELDKILNVTLQKIENMQQPLLPFSFMKHDFTLSPHVNARFDTDVVISTIRKKAIFVNPVHHDGPKFFSIVEKIPKEGARLSFLYGVESSWRQLKNDHDIIFSVSIQDGELECETHTWSIDAAKGNDKWLQAHVDLNNYAGKDVEIKFSVTCPSCETAPGSAVIADITLSPNEYHE